MGLLRFVRSSWSASSVVWAPTLFLAISVRPMALAEAKDGKYVSHPVMTTDGTFKGVREESFRVKVREVVTPAKAIFADGTTVVLDGIALEGVPPAIYEKGLRLSKRLLEGKTVDFWGREEMEDGTTIGRIRCSSGRGFRPLQVRDSFPRGILKWTEAVDLNAELIAQGFARVDRNSPEAERLLLRIEKEARDARRGLWGIR